MADDVVELLVLVGVGGPGAGDSQHQPGARTQRVGDRCESDETGDDHARDHRSGVVGGRGGGGGRRAVGRPARGRRGAGGDPADERPDAEPDDEEEQDVDNRTAFVAGDLLVHREAWYAAPAVRLDRPRGPMSVIG